MSVFHFRDFDIRQANAGLKVGTDAMILGASIHSDNKEKGLDVGTGTGVLSLMVAQRNPKIEIIAIENEEGAIEDARFNFKNCSFENDIKAVNQNFLDFESNEKFDLIFTNPPFYTDSKLSSSDKLNQAKHVDGLTPITLLPKVKGFLSEKGSFWIIWPFQTEKEIVDVSKSIGLQLQARIVVNGKPNTPNRVILKFGFQSLETIQQILTIRDNSGEYSKEYKKLTKEFHNRAL